VAPRAFRAARRHGLLADAEALALALEPSRGTDLPAPLSPERVGLAAGWFVAGDDEAGNRVLNAAREALFLSVPGAAADRTKLATAYAEALGFAPHGIALGRLEELFQRLERVEVQSSVNRYFTLYPLHLLDTVVRAVVTDDFAISPAVRAWLDDDEFLIRRRVHRDMANVLRADG
jgi:cellulose synthase operon protein C